MVIVDPGSSKMLISWMSIVVFNPNKNGFLFGVVTCPKPVCLSECNLVLMDTSRVGDKICGVEDAFLSSHCRFRVYVHDSSIHHHAS